MWVRVDDQGTLAFPFEFEEGNGDAVAVARRALGDKAQPAFDTAARSADRDPVHCSELAMGALQSPCSEPSFAASTGRMESTDPSQELAVALPSRHLALLQSSGLGRCMDLEQLMLKVSEIHDDVVTLKGNTEIKGDTVADWKSDLPRV